MPPLRRTALHPPLRYTIARRQASGGHTPTAEILPTHKGPHGNFHNSIIQSFGGCNSVRQNHHATHLPKLPYPLHHRPRRSSRFIVLLLEFNKEIV